MKKSIDRVHEEAREKYHKMCGTPFEQIMNSVEAKLFDELVRSGIVILADADKGQDDWIGNKDDVQRCDVDMRFFEEFDVRWW